jgi:hypothetical protein
MLLSDLPKEILYCIFDNLDLKDLRNVLFVSKKIYNVVSNQKWVIKSHLLKQNFTHNQIKKILYESVKNNFLDKLYHKIKIPILALYHVFIDYKPELFINKFNKMIQEREITPLHLLQAFGEKILDKRTPMGRRNTRECTKVYIPDKTSVSMIYLCISRKCSNYKETLVYLIDTWANKFFKEIVWLNFVKVCILKKNVHCFGTILSRCQNIDTNINWNSVFVSCSSLKDVRFLEVFSKFLTKNNIRIFISKITIRNLMKARLFKNVLYIIRTLLKEFVNCNMYVIEISKFFEPNNHYCSLIYKELAPKKQLLLQRIKMNTNYNLNKYQNVKYSRLRV